MLDSAYSAAISGGINGTNLFQAVNVDFVSCCISGIPDTLYVTYGTMIGSNKITGAYDYN